MKKTEIELKKIESVTDVICDCCGKSCKTGDFEIDNQARTDHGERWRSFEYMSLSANWGYESGKDLQTWTAQICEKCVDEKLGFIKFKVETTRLR